MALPNPRAVAGTEPAVGPVFDRVRDTLQISWVPPVFVALGEMPRFLELAWAQLEPSLATAQFAQLAGRIRRDALATVQSLYRPSYGPGDVQQVGVPLAEQATVRSALEALIFGQTQTLLATKALRMALEDCPPGGQHPISWPRSSTTWAMQPLPTVDEESVGERDRRIFADARASLRLPWVPRSLLMLGRWPGYLQLAWNDLAGVFRTPEFGAAQTELIEQSAAYCDLFPVKVDLTPGRLKSQGLSPFEIHRARKILLDADAVEPANLLLTVCLRDPLGGNRATERSWRVTGAHV